MIGSQNIKEKDFKFCPVGRATNFSVMAFSSALRLLLRGYVGIRKLQDESGWVLLPQGILLSVHVSSSASPGELWH